MHCRICQTHSSDVGAREGIVVFGDPDNHQNASMICPTCLAWILHNQTCKRPLWSRLIPFLLLFFLFAGLALALRCVFWGTMADAIRVDRKDTGFNNNSPSMSNRKSPEFYLPEM
jgi:hypothetical protein